jgi:hypothetical protein
MDVMKMEAEVANAARTNEQASVFSMSELAEMQLALVGGGIGDVQI